MTARTLLGAVAQAALLLLLAPLVTGFIRAAKANLQSRRGPGVLQPYRDLAKSFRKGMVVSEHASFVFHLAPPAVFVTALAAGLMVPAAGPAPLALFGGALALVGLLALGRFALALAALDTGSAFGGMGASREMTISAIAEPALVLALFTAALLAGSTDLGEMAAARAGAGIGAASPSSALALASLFIVLIAETGRLPVDNPATHLELTMIHEAMVLEYSGPYLALLEWGGAVKQLVLMTLLVNVFAPYGPTSPVGLLATAAGGVPAAGGAPVPADLIGLAVAAGWYAAKLGLLAVCVVLVETTNAKLRLFRVPELLSVAFVLAALALAFTVIA